MKTASIILLSFGVGLLAAGLLVFVQIQMQTIEIPLTAAPSPLPPAPTVTGFGSSFEVPEKPVRLLIPTIGVDAFIQSVGLSLKNTGQMGIPTNFIDTAWYNLGPRPGMPGNAVIDGHMDGDGKQVIKAVFYDLKKLVPGDMVEVADERGTVFQFQVVGSAMYDYNAPTADIFFGDSGAARLNLITCAGDWIQSKKIYDKRVVVFTELVASR